MAKRKPISKKARFEIFKRDGFVCQYCGAHPPETVLHVDHIIPVAEGGDNDQDNLITSCEACNLGKGARSLADIPKSLKDKATDIAEKEAQLRGYQEIMESRRNRIDEEAWRVAELLEPGCSSRGINRDRIQSIRQFVEKLGVHEVLDAADIARAKLIYSDYKQFRYFCGVCWNKIRSGDGAR